MASLDKKRSLSRSSSITKKRQTTKKASMKRSEKKLHTYEYRWEHGILVAVAENEGTAEKQFEKLLNKMKKDNARLEKNNPRNETVFDESSFRFRSGNVDFVPDDD